MLGTSDNMEFSITFGPTIVTEEDILDEELFPKDLAWDVLEAEDNDFKKKQELNFSYDLKSKGRRPGPSPHKMSKMCARWRTNYKDHSIGDYYTSAGINYLPAKYAYAKIWKYASGSPEAWHGYLDGNGCTPVMYLDRNSSYFMDLNSVMQRCKHTPWWPYSYDCKKIRVQKATLDPSNAGCYDYSYTDENNKIDDACYDLSLLKQTRYFHHNNGGTFSINFSYAGDHRPNVSFMAGQMLASEASSIPVGSHEIYTDITYESWPGKGDQYSCYDFHTPALFIDGDGGNWKYLVGHEFGHRLQYESTGPFSYTYNEIHDETQCRCDHVAHSSQLHCLNSEEQYAAALQEGFAHFFSAKVWNNENQNDCNFGYYKNTLIYMEQVSLWYTMSPPVDHDCKAAHQWRNTYCGGNANKGVEMDWLSFFWNWHTQAHASMDEIYDVITRTRYKGSVIWENFKQAAKDKWISDENNPVKYQKFLFWAITNGVDDE